ncbi:hypothetical protein HMPREF0491_00487 [Lachnospiraceae oral taxon 107 str. F0167]|nr:hypothetical protein HMPREF0491_00487 [Lachnospiraceae oral taxon 107 str. F0167]
MPFFITKEVNLKKELTTVKNKIRKLKDKKALIDEELEPLLIREEELENEEIVAICRKNNITIADLMAKFRKKQSEIKKSDETEKETATLINKNNNENEENTDENN